MCSMDGWMDATTIFSQKYTTRKEKNGRVRIGGDRVFRGLDGREHGLCIHTYMYVFRVSIIDSYVICTYIGAEPRHRISSSWKPCGHPTRRRYRNTHLPQTISHHSLGSPNTNQHIHTFIYTTTTTREETK